MTQVDLEKSGSQLFTLRFWQEDLGAGKTDWRGKIQHINSGDVSYFRDWHALEQFLQDQLNISDFQLSNGNHT